MEIYLKIALTQFKKADLRAFSFKTGRKKTLGLKDDPPPDISPAGFGRF